MSKGINQLGRVPQELRRSYVLPDERTFFDLIDFTLKYSEKVNFFDFSNTPNNSWRSFLMSDFLFIIASIAGQDISYYKVRHEALKLQLEESAKRKKEELISQQSANLLALAKNLFDWEESLLASGYKGVILKELKNASSYLETDIRKLIQLQSKFSESSFNFYPGNSMDKSPADLDELFKLFYKNVMFVQEKASQKFDLDQIESNQHQPHIGLIISFLKLFQEVQNQQNNLLERHLDYYYQEILGQMPAEPKPATAYLGIESLGLEFLPANTQVEMKTEAKSSLTFNTLTDTPVSQAKITEIWTVYQNTYSPFTDNVFDQESELNSIFDECLYQGEPCSSVDFTNHKGGYPMVLGEDQESLGKKERTVFPSDIGLVITSPVLILAEGEHRIKISIQLTSDSFIAIQNLLASLLTQKRESESGDISDLEKKSFFQAFFNKALNVSVTGMKGWVNLSYSYFSVDIKTHKLELFLEPEYPNEFLVPFDEKIHGGFSGTAWPCVRLLINNFASLPSYKPLKLLKIKEIEIETQSANSSVAILASNQLGKLDVSNPFQPFGPLPGFDSYFKIYSPLILNRHLQNLQLNLYWTGLPKSRKGFESYYEGYPEQINNESFQADLLSFQKHFLNQDVDAKDKQTVSLFETKKSGDGSLEANKHINVNIKLLETSNFPVLGNPIYRGKEPAFFLKLKEPRSMIFGHQIYPELFTRASLRKGFFKKETAIVPNLPYTPTLDHIDVLYSNWAKENLSRSNSEDQDSIKLIHIYPFGYEEVYPGSKKGFEFLMPQINRKGNLLIGLSGLTPNSVISIGFDLVPAFFIHSVTKAPAISWEFLENNEWYPLDKLLLEDSTESLIHPGIVRIRLPTKIYSQHSILPSGKFWLRISNSGRTELNSRIKAVFINAVKVREQLPAIRSVKPQESFPKIISADVLGYKNIKSVSGPYGLKFFTKQQNPIHAIGKTSETLRHRNRPSIGWDIERIILEEFPEIGRAMVYGRSDFPNSIVSGSNIQVVVVPLSFDSSVANYTLFRVPFGLLQDIKEYLKQFISPYASLEVCNPVFEKIKVRCTVKFIEFQMAGLLRDRLEKELIEFLAPDPISDAVGKGFMNSISKSEILNFIESKPYVESVSGFSVLQIIESPGNNRIIDTAKNVPKIEVLRTITPYAILTSAEQHQIEIIQKDDWKDPRPVGIGDLTIDSDFIIK
ncbi:hypothetical protein [Algoriphagus aquimarinus]|uniref:hypothetical protein n=1 Tax=Algoriphagus aquimarinus TaxID=237018 RepID=UPI0030DC8179|tara:strand:+ start:402318 stop:405905 length:3588 start_codon:yes stop_codon:yes gene_type:complete